jgi:hypothetical protein
MIRLISIWVYSPGDGLSRDIKFIYNESHKTKEECVENFKKKFNIWYKAEEEVPNKFTTEDEILMWMENESDPDGGGFDKLIHEFLELKS